MSNLKSANSTLIHNPGKCNIWFDKCPRCGQMSKCPVHGCKCEKMTVTEVAKNFKDCSPQVHIVIKALKRRSHAVASRKYRARKKGLVAA